MKKSIIISVLLLMYLISAGQNNLGKMNDIERIAIKPVVPAKLDISNRAANVLKMRMQKIISLNGLSTDASRGCFMMIPRVAIIDKNVTSTAPVMHVINAEVSFIIIDASNRTIFKEISTSVKGIGKTESAAYTKIFSSINPRAGKFKKFIKTSKEKIIEYYNTNCDDIITKSRTLASMGKFEESLFILSNVPNTCKLCYDRANDISIDIFQQYTDKSSKENLNKAKNSWAKGDTDGAVNLLKQISPDAVCYPEASKLMDKIRAEVISDREKEDNLKMMEIKSADDRIKQQERTKEQLRMKYLEELENNDESFNWVYE